MARVHGALIGTALLLGSNALAAEAAFENHLTSTPMVSPAQLYQVTDLKTDFKLGYTAEDASDKSEGRPDLTDNASGADVFASAIYNVKAVGLRAGVAVNYRSLNGEGDILVNNDPQNTTKLTKNTKETRISPQAAYPVGPVVVGAAFDYVQREEKVEDLDQRTASFGTFRPGALFASGPLEAGLTYATATNRTVKDEEDREKELDVKEPAKVTAHGRYAVDRDLAVGGILGTQHFAGLDKDAYKDRTVVKGTAEYGMGPLKVEGDLGYNTAYYKDKDKTLTEDTIGTYALGAAADYEVARNTAVGGGVGYEFGSDSNAATKVAKSELTLALRGNMRF